MKITPRTKGTSTVWYTLVDIRDRKATIDGLACGGDLKVERQRDTTERKTPFSSGHMHRRLTQESIQGGKGAGSTAGASWLRVKEKVQGGNNRDTEEMKGNGEGYERKRSTSGGEAPPGISVAELFKTDALRSKEGIQGWTEDHAERRSWQAGIST